MEDIPLDLISHMDKKDFETFSDVFGTEMIDIYVGRERKHFRAHKSILSKKIPFFKGMFSGEWMESTTGKVEMIEDDVDAFDVILGWVYNCNTRPYRFINKDEIKYSFDFIGVYCLADKLGINAVKDELMNQLRSLHRHFSITAEYMNTEKVYAETPSGCPLRKYHAQAWYFLKASRKAIDCAKHTPRLVGLLANEEFAHDFMTSIHLHTHSNTQNLDPKYAPCCAFHHHGSEKCRSQPTEPHPFEHMYTLMSEPGLLPEATSLRSRRIFRA